MTAGEVFPLPGELLGDGDGPVFLLKMPDGSMAGEGIGCDDWVIVRQGTDPADKTIVAAMIDGNATVRTFRRAGGLLWLEPNDPRYEFTPSRTTTTITGSRAHADVAVMGTVTAVIHRIAPGDG